MTTVYIAMVADRHRDPEPYVFTTAEAALEFAERFARESARRPEDFMIWPDTPPEWMFHASYSGEGDAVWVLAKVIDAT